MAARVEQRQKNSGKIRSRDISDDLYNLLSAVGDELDVYFEIGSGGQSSDHDPKTKGKEWTGSHRHDDGGAADTKIYKLENGEKRYLDWTDPNDQAVWSDVVRLSKAGGATGFGAGTNYMGNQTVHIGYGKPATWGTVKKGGPPPPDWLVSSVKAGETTPPLNIPNVASQMDTTQTAPAPMPGRPAALGSSRSVRSLGASFGDTGSAADSVTPRLGWENNQQSWNGRDARQIIPSADNAKARLAAGNILGGAADDQMRSLGMPAPTMQPGMLGRSSVQPPVAAPTLDETRLEQNAMRRVTPTATVPTVVAPTPMSRPVVAPMAPTPMSRPVVAPVAQQQAPQPMPRPVGVSQPAAQPIAPAPKLLRLPSGKMVAPGSYQNDKNGITYQITEGANGEAVVTPQRAGAINIGREMNAPTLAGGFIRSQIPAALETAKDSIGTAATAVKDTASSAIDTVTGKAAELGSTLGNAFSGFGNFLGGNAQQPKPAAATPTFQTGMLGRGSVPQITAPMVPPSPNRVTTSVQTQTDTSPPSMFKGSATGRTYRIGQTYQSSRGPVIATANGFQPANAASRPSARQSRAERFTNIDSFGNII